MGMVYNDTVASISQGEPSIPVLPDGLNQLLLRDVLFAVIIATVNILDVCKSA